MDDLFDVNEKVVLVTGGLGQLGRRFTLALLDRGAKVGVFDLRTDEKLVAERFGERRSDNNLRFYQVDVTKRTSIEDGLRAVSETWGTPYGLVNNAAIDAPPNASAKDNGPFESYPDTSWDRTMQVNVKGVFLCCQVVGGRMAEAGRGSIVNICSIYGMVSPDQRIYDYRRRAGAPFYKPADYSASKSALLSLTRYLATYWAHKNVRVNSLTFSGVFNNQDEEFLKAYSTHVPLGRMAREEECVGPLIFLISNASSYMTGSNLVVDGGWTAW